MSTSSTTRVDLGDRMISGTRFVVVFLMGVIFGLFWQRGMPLTHSQQLNIGTSGQGLLALFVLMYVYYEQRRRYVIVGLIVATIIALFPTFLLFD